MNPHVSVVIATRNRPRELLQAVQSVFAQTYRGDIECLVVYDQSDVRLPDVSARPGRKLRGLQNGRTPGLAGARNTGIEAASGDLVAFCDDDDQWLPEKLERQVETLVRNGETSVIGCGIVIATGKRHVPRLPPRPRIDTSDLIRSRRADLHPSTILVWRHVLLGKIGLIDECIPHSYGEDYDWLLRAAQHWPIATIPEPLVRVNWRRESWFAGRWQATIDAHEYLLRKHPEIAKSRPGLARIYGQLAFAHAALRHKQALPMARRSMRLYWRQPRGYLAYAVYWRMLRADRVARWLNSVGRGI